MLEHRRTRSSYVSSWLTFLRTHELVGEHRLKFAAQLGEMSDELNALGKEVDKNRKAAKELASKLEKGLQEQEALVDRVRCLNRPLLACLVADLNHLSSRRFSAHPRQQARVRFDSAAEDLERLLVLKQGEMVTPSSVPHAGSSHAAGASSKGRSFGKAMSKLKGPKNAAQYAKQEEEVRSRMGQTSDSYRAQVSGAQSLRQEYFQTQLPRLLRVSLGVFSRCPLLTSEPFFPSDPERERRRTRPRHAVPPLAVCVLVRECPRHRGPHHRASRARGW